MKGFKNCNIYINNKEIKKTSLTISNGKIESFKTPKEDYLEFGNEYTIVPGFIDKHTHGVNGFKFAGCDVLGLESIVKDKAKEGVSSMVATFSALKVEEVKKFIPTIVDFIKNNPLGKSIIGIHLEGPFLAPDYRGGNPLENIILGTVDTFNEMVGEYLPYICQVTVDPKFCDNDLLVHLKNNNIALCVGHAGNTYAEVKEAMKLGLNCASHIYASSVGLTGQEVGVIGAALLEDDMYCEVIADNFSVSKEAMKLLYKCKGNDKICVITDSSATSHLPDGVHQVGAKTIHIENKTAKTPEGKYAGSVLWVNDGVRNLKNNLELSLEKAVNFASKNNADALKVQNIGEISLNKDADFTVVDKDLNVVLTVSKGNVIYKA